MADDNPDTQSLPGCMASTEPPPLPIRPVGTTDASSPIKVIATRSPAPEPNSHLQRIGMLRIIVAFVVSAISDAVSIAAEIVPPVEIAVDLVTACLLWMLLGWRWVMLPAFIAEAIPGLAMFPTWLLVTTACVVSPKVKSGKQ